MTMEVPDKLKTVAKRLKDELNKGVAPDPERLTVRQFLSWFGVERRGSQKVGQIRNILDELDLRAVPEFDVAWVDSEISIELDPAAVDGVAASEGAPDPTIRIGVIEAANKPPVVVQPDKALEVATTLMQAHDFSQLPVMPTPFEVKGVISWESIGTKLSLGKTCSFVRDCMNPDVGVVSHEMPLVSAIGAISQHGYVLVEKAGKVSGIVTSTDVVEQFMQLAGPFIHIGEIEGYLRSLIHRRFTRPEMEEALSRGEDQESRSETAPKGLALGDYCQLLGRDSLWKKLNLKLDRKTFWDKLDEVRRLRNDVMHFRPEGLEEHDVKSLEGFAKFLRSLKV